LEFWCCSISTHYTLRSGASNRGTYCGAFLIDNGDVASYAAWTRAAALLWLASYYSMRGGISIDDLYCGIFCNSIGNYYGRSGWSVGVALSLYTLYSS
jgi:hypothetical protein